MLIDTVVNGIAFVFVLGVLIVIHEAGHFLVARWSGARVPVFSVGFGRRLWGIERGGTDYRLSLIPLGGYVRIVGLGPDESDLVESDVVAAEDLEAPLLPRWKRALILLAGPVTNIGAALLLVAAAFMMGMEVPIYLDEPPVVGGVAADSPAEGALEPGDRILAVDGTAVESWRDLEMAMMTTGGRRIEVDYVRDGEATTARIEPEAVTRYQFGYSGILPPLDPVVDSVMAGPAARGGLEAGDRIVSIEGRPIGDFWDLVEIVSARPGEELEFVVERDGARRTLTIVPEDDAGRGKIGIPITFPTRTERLGPIAALGTATTESVRITEEVFRVIGRLFTGRARIRQTMSGPIDIARVSGEAARTGLRHLVWLMGVISLQLGIFNLLPIPVLDGGHLAILAVEGTIRRDLSAKVKTRILEVGFVLIVLLMVVVLYNDVVKILPQSVYEMLPGSGP